ncbi:MAG: endonuclease/exonuclease/phosphatase family protein [Archangiaceae bacterium]|nr:endonuclease/exonuclease/phosphatase family protein [Archangiaceae bacterium]
MPDNKVQTTPRMEAFRAEMRKAKADGEHPWVGMHAVAEAMFGPSVILPREPGDEHTHMKLSAAQMRKLAENPAEVNAQLTRLQAAGEVPADSDAWSVKGAAKQFAEAAKAGLESKHVTATTTHKGNLRLMTFNIKHATLSDLKSIAAMIKKYKPDMVALQEVDKNRPRSGHINQTQRLAKLTGMHGTFQPALNTHDGGQYGVALLSKYPIKSSKRVPLPFVPGHEPRVLLKAKVNVNGTMVPVDVTHLTHLGGAERTRQMRKVMKSIEPDKNTILMGDFNAAVGSPTYNMADAEFHDTWKEGHGGPGHRIDYIWTGNGFKTVKAWIPKAGHLSDHQPRISVVHLKHADPKPKADDLSPSQLPRMIRA